MFTKTMTFDDLDDNEVKETFYFNFTKKEIAELLEFGKIQKFARPGDEAGMPLEEMMNRLKTPVEESGLTQQENTRQAYNIFVSLLLDAYGRKASDNRGFEKNHELREYWSNHNAFVELVFEFIANPDQANEFIERCLPGKMVAAAKKEMQRENAGKLSGESLAEMVAEAERRQQDPATRIEPGPEAARAALGSSPEMEALAGEVAANPPTSVDDKPQNELTAADIPMLSDAAFAKLDPRKLSNEALRASFERKTKA